MFPTSSGVHASRLPSSVSRLSSSVVLFLRSAFHLPYLVPYSYFLSLRLSALCSMSPSFPLHPPNEYRTPLLPLPLPRPCPPIILLLPVILSSHLISPFILASSSSRSEYLLIVSFFLLLSRISLSLSLSPHTCSSHPPLRLSRSSSRSTPVAVAANDPGRCVWRPHHYICSSDAKLEATRGTQGRGVYMHLAPPGHPENVTLKTGRRHPEQRGCMPSETR